MVKRNGLTATKKIIPWQKHDEEEHGDTSLHSLISEEEWNAREQRHHQRIQDVKVCLGFISESVEGYEALLKLQSTNEYWNRYVNCDGLPHVQEPPELRHFLAKILHFEDLDEKELVNWALSVDERSVLTQDIDAKDMTRKTLKENLCPNIGKLYDDAVQRILIVLSRIQLLLETEHEMAEMHPDRALEISRIRMELSNAINLLFNKLTYRIICAPSSYKTLTDGLTESYCYQSSKFDMQIWWLCDVNIRFKFLELPLMVAKLNCVGVNVQIPMRVLRDNLTLRCVHTFFDFYSENAKSYDRIIEKSTGDLNAGMTDIEDCLINEWLMQVSIMNQMITRMEQKCIIYEEHMRELEPQLAIKDQSGRHKMKPPKEPQRLPEGMFPDPYNTFLVQEQQELKEFLEQYLNPHNLQLHPDEINLRRYKILGGIFSLGFVHKPKHTDFNEFNRTSHDEDRLLLTLDHLRAFADQYDEEIDDADAEKPFENPFTERLKPKAKSVDSSRSRETIVSHLLVDEARNDKSLHLQGDDIKYFFVTIQLPEQLCRFSEPVACQYLDEFVEEDEPEEEVSVETEERRSKKKRRRATPKPTRETTQGKTARAEPRTMVPAFGHSHGTSQSQRSTTKKSQVKKSTTAVEDTNYMFKRPKLSIITPRHSVANNIYRTSRQSALRSLILRHSLLSGPPLRNFSLVDGPLDIGQITDLQKHCIPRILSSFKFPQEFRNEQFEAFTERTKGNKILRRNQAVKAEVYTEEPEYFSYEKQQASERLYPMFDRREKAIYEQDSSTGSSQSDLQVKVVKIDQIRESVKPDDAPNQTMYSLVQTLEDIQKKYLERPGRLARQANIEFRNRSRTQMETPAMVTAKPKSSVRISTIGSRLVHIPPRASRAAVRHSNAVESSSLDSTGSPSIGSVVSVGFRHVKTYGSRDQSDEGEEEPKRKVRLVNVKHWTTKHIVDAEFNRETFTVTIKTDRLGLFGFAFKLYDHFPFRDWKLQQSEEQPNEIIFTLDTFHVRVILFISNIGIRGYVTKISNEYTANPVKYMEIEEPISDYRELRRRFLEKNINIFAELDACYYIDNGYFSEKHLSTELHVYDAFAVHCKLMKFYRCDWNRLATRRDLILCLRNPKDFTDAADVTVRVTPDSSTFVEVFEPCSLDLDEVKLDYQPTWRNIGTYSDLHQLITSMYPNATDVRNRDPKLIHYLRTLFTEVRPLSFS